MENWPSPEFLILHYSILLLMKTFRLFLILSLLPISLTPAIKAQDEPTASAAWQITKFDITVNAPTTERVLAARAILTARNVGRGTGSTLSLRISPKAEVKSVTVNDAPATFVSREETRQRTEATVASSLQRVAITLNTPAAPGTTLTVALDYRLPVGENTGNAALSIAGSQFLPRSYWYPFANPTYALRGADVAPVRLTVNGAGGDTIISSGRATGQTFEQTLNVQPFFLTGTWDISEGTNGARGVTAYMSKGASADERKRADDLIALAASARSFFASLLGAAPDVPVRLVAVKRGTGFTDGGTILLDVAAFRRPKLDAVTALEIAEAMARLWVGGVAPVRGEGNGVVREGLPRYLATLFLEKQFGRDVADAERVRERVAYEAIAKVDPPLARSNVLDIAYQNSTTNKGAMFWRLAERAVGRDALLNILRSSIQAGVGDMQGLTLQALRASLEERGGASVKGLMDQELDQPTDMDLMVGLPQQKGAQWVAALRNTGAMDASVTVAATTATGERLTAQVTVPARNFGEAAFNTTARITRIEVDPDKFYPQVDYTNDVAPRPALSSDPMIEATTKFTAQDFAGAEAAARAELLNAPSLQEARIILARSLLAENKLDEAEREFRTALDDKLPTPSTLVWSNVGLGEISFRRGQFAESAKRFSDAVRTEAEYISTQGQRNETLRTSADYAARLAARLGRIKAEAGAKSAPAIDDSAKAFVALVDQAIKGGRRADLESVILPGELVTFISGIVGSQPEAWSTQVVRTEQLDANRLAADVTINMRQFGRDQSGTATLILQRVGNGWKLSGIELFEVK
jgi:tetratricopeptide (TPR) repeat protein